MTSVNEETGGCLKGWPYEMPVKDLKIENLKAKQEKSYMRDAKNSEVQQFVKRCQNYTRAVFFLLGMVDMLKCSLRQNLVYSIFFYPRKIKVQTFFRNVWRPFKIYLV